jgi:hypothetical protein
MNACCVTNTGNRSHQRAHQRTAPHVGPGSGTGSTRQGSERADHGRHDRADRHDAQVVDVDREDARVLVQVLGEILPADGVLLRRIEQPADVAVQKRAQ